MALDLISSFLLAVWLSLGILKAPNIESKMEQSMHTTRELTPFPLKQRNISLCKDYVLGAKNSAGKRREEERNCLFYSNDGNKFTKGYCHVTQHQMLFIFCRPETVRRLPLIFKMAAELI